MAALGALVKKVWSVRRVLVLLCAPLALVPVLLSLPPKVPGHGGVDADGEHRPWSEGTGAAAWGHPLGHTEQGTLAAVQWPGRLATGDPDWWALCGAMGQGHTPGTLT